MLIFFVFVVFAFKLVNFIILRYNFTSHTSECVMSVKSVFQWGLCYTKNVFYH